MDTLAERLKKLRGSMSQKEAADYVGISQQMWSKLESGKTKETSLIPTIAEKFEVDAIELATGRPASIAGVREGKPDDRVSVKMIKGIKASAGPGEAIYDFEEVDNYHSYRIEFFQSRQINPKNCKVIEVRGDSMYPIIPHGSYVLVHIRDREPIHTKIYAIVDDDELRLKRLMKRADGTWAITSDNPDKIKFPDEVFVPGKVAIYGRVRDWSVSD